MNEFIERLAQAIFLSQYRPDQHAEALTFWPDRLDEFQLGPPFRADGYRDAVLSVLAAMEQPSQRMIEHAEATGAATPAEIWRAMITAELLADRMESD